MSQENPPPPPPFNLRNPPPLDPASSELQQRLEDCTLRAIIKVEREKDSLVEQFLAAYPFVPIDQVEIKIRHLENGLNISVGFKEK